MVFDCNVDSKGTSLNKKLVSSPDLVKQIVGVIIRFCVEPIVIMGDKETIFNQVLVLEYDHSFLRFLFRVNHDINGTVEDFEMKVLVFGVTLSPSSCNYVLKRTAVDNRKKYHPDVAFTFQKKFCADNLLKSAKDVPTTIRLLYNIRMGANRGFKLTKIIRNRVEVLQSVT